MYALSLPGISLGSWNLGPMMSQMAAFADATPDVTRYPFVSQMWAISAGLAPGLVSLLILSAVGSAWWDELTGSVSSTVRAAALRGAMAIGGGLLSLHIVSWLILMNNLLSQTFAVKAALLPPPPGDLVGSWLGTLIGLVPYAAVLLGVSLIYIMRLAELTVLCVLAPLALAMAAHPAGWNLARSWWAEVLAVTGLQVVQAVLLATFALIVRDTPGLVGLPMDVATSLALAYLVLRLPGWLRGWVHTTIDATPDRLWTAFRKIS